jgi:hypothetical protein
MRANCNICVLKGIIIPLKGHTARYVLELDDEPDMDKVQTIHIHPRINNDPIEKIDVDAHLLGAKLSEKDMEQKRREFVRYTDA